MFMFLTNQNVEKMETIHSLKEKKNRRNYGLLDLIITIKNRLNFIKKLGKNQKRNDVILLS